MGGHRIINPARPSGGGNKRTVVVCEVAHGLMYILETGCQSLPAEFSRNAPKFQE